jgi:ribose 5-phosphate isomerase
LRSIPGILETGLFIKMADAVFVGLSNGEVKLLEAR